MSGGGGSSNSYYSNLNELYGKQGAQLDRLMQIQDRNVIPGYDRLSTEAQQSGGIGEQNQAAGNVITQGRSELAAAKEATNRDLESMGVNPNDRRFVGLDRGNDVAGAAQIASAANQARQGVKATGFARRKDVVGMGMGIPGQASETMAGMGNTIGQQIAGRNQQQSAANAGLTSLGTLGTMALMMKDGGPVRRRSLPMQRRMPRVAPQGHGAVYMAQGGPVGGFFQPINAPQAPASNAQQPRGAGLNPVSAMILAKNAKGSAPIGDKLSAIGAKLNSSGGHIMAKVGNATGNDALVQQGVERSLTSNGLDAESAHNLISGPDGLMPAQSAATQASGGVPVSAGAQTPTITGAAPATAATPAAETGLGSLPGSVAPAEQAFGGALGEAGAGEGVTLAADSAIGATGGAAAAEGVAAGGAAAGAAGAGTAALAAVSAAMPWIGAGIAVGSMLGLFADGGKVDMRSGGNVSGPGTSTSDSIPAHLSDGEFVVNAEGVKIIGEHNLDRINAAGLAARKGVRMADGGFVGSAGSLADGIVRGLGITRQMQAQDQDRQVRDLQIQQAQLGIDSAQRDQAEKTRRMDATKAVQDWQTQFLNGRDPSQLNDNEVQAFRSGTATQMVQNKLLNPDQVAEQMGVLKKAADEGAYKAIQVYAQTGGDKNAALQAFNRFGNVKDATDIQLTPVTGQDGMRDHVIRITRADGSTMDTNLSDLAIANGVGAPYIAAQEARMKSAKMAAETKKDLATASNQEASAEYQRGHLQLARDLADEKHQNALDVAAIKASGGNSQAKAAAGEIKSWTKWQDDLNTAKTLPQIPLKDAEGRPMMKGMDPQYQPDPAVMPTIRDLARANRKQIEAARVDPEEFGQVASAVHQATRAKSPAEMYDTLDKTGKLQIIQSKTDKSPIGAAILLGTDPDTGEAQLMRLPKSVADKVLGEEARRRDQRQRVEYPDEARRMGVPNLPPSAPVTNSPRPNGGSRMYQGKIGNPNAQG